LGSEAHFLNQLRDRFGVGDHALDISGEIIAKAQVRDVKESVHYGAQQHVVGYQIGGRRAGCLIAPANHLPHLQAATGEGQRAEPTPVIPPALIVDARSASEFTGDHE